MKIAVPFLLIIGHVAALRGDTAYTRRKRSVENLCMMLKHKTGHCIEYLFHGNFCGPGGRGIPVDHTDRCCFEHDRCFQRTSQFCNSKVFRLYIKSYKWGITPDGNVHCDPYDMCELQHCECDRIFSHCAAMAYHEAHPGHPIPLLEELGLAFFM